MIALLVFFGFLSGVTMVLFGFGGGFVAVPLIYRLVSISHPGEAMHAAVATSTAVMIFNALFSSWRHRGNLMWSAIFPMAFYIAAGSALGALMSLSLPDGVVRWLFVAYLLVTIADCLFRDGFLTARSESRQLPRGRQAAYGLGVGAIATMLGVGGSVMTVPLMRRLGSSMKTAVAVANPLSIPVGVVGALLYGILSYGKGVSLGAGFVGYVDVVALAVLVVTGFAGIVAAGGLLPKIPDAVHAKAYLAFLTLALASML